ncbi:MAG: DUF881 domain-containing protein [Clostridium sp.]|uniref:DUF881 domain-containing protein n=1 Tax=Clostridium sp. TaxID=1506 RepID=UPI0030329A30
MKKLIAKLSVGFIFLMFGFVMITQLNTIDKQNTVSKDSSLSPEILIENEQLKKQKEELEAKIDELMVKSEEYENAAAGKTDESSVLLEELQQTRLRAGLMDVQGQGIIMYITPKTNLFGTQEQGYPISDYDLLAIVNELYAAGAEAVSVNDIRLVGNSGIRASGKDIRVNNVRISPNERVTIKAIGSKSVLFGAMDFRGNIPESLRNRCDVTYDMKDLVSIKKDTKPAEYKYITESTKK